MLDDEPDDFPENILKSPIEYHVSFYPSSILCFDGKKSQGHDRIQVMPPWRLRRDVSNPCGLPAQALSCALELCRRRWRIHLGWRFG